MGKLIKDISIAMLTTVDEQGVLRSRPMMTQQIEFNGDLWFFTGVDTEKVGEVHSHRQVNVSYSKPEEQRYVSVTGTAEVINDRAKMQELWGPIYKAWFPKGLNDPNLRLLKVSVEEAEYWDAPASGIASALGFFKALATGRRARVGENREVELER